MSNIPVYCKISGILNTTLTGTITGPLAGGANINYTFPTTFSMSAIGAYNFTCYTAMPGDGTHSNDTTKTSISVLQPTISSYPSLNDYNATNGYWLKGSNSSDTSRHFTWGTVPYLGGAQGNGNSWYLTVPNNGGGDVWVQSPVYDFTNETDPILSMDIKYELSNNNNQVIVQYSVNGGANWSTLGSASDLHWYNNTNNNSWNNATQANWTHVSHNLCSLSGLSCVIFRISTSNLYYSGSNAYFAFDNFRISASGGDDLAPLEVMMNNTGNCGSYSANEPISVIIENNTCRTLSNVPANLSMTGSGSASINETMPDQYLHSDAIFILLAAS